jgi:endonuclease III
MTTSITPTVHLARVYDLLIGAYGVPINRPDYDPLGGLVGTILSQHTSDINSDRAYKQLVSIFPTWEEVRDAPTHLLAEAIRSGGLANIKAVRIQDALLTESRAGKPRAFHAGDEPPCQVWGGELLQRP